ncbi:MAG: DUF4239 domain-containing protein [Chloroflexi bacterium]|nr:DUF4239 domain-containing protein [Chloroflexota bacterium]
MFHAFLNNLPNVPLAIGILLLCAAIGAASVWLTRRFFNVAMLREHNDIIGYIYQMLGVVYAVMLAFAVFIVWEQFDTTNTAVEQEANTLVALHDIARALPDAAGAQLKGDVVNYAHVVATDEWEQMARAHASDASQQALLRLTRFEREFRPATDHETVLYAQAIGHIEKLNAFRRLRLQASRGQIPRPMWVLLIGGGLFMVGFTAIFGATNARLHIALTAVLAAALGFTLFIILALDTPYTGSFAITQEPFNGALALFTSNP